MYMNIEHNHMVNSEKRFNVILHTYAVGPYHIFHVHRMQFKCLFQLVIYVSIYLKSDINELEIGAPFIE